MSKSRSTAIVAALAITLGGCYGGMPGAPGLGGASSAVAVASSPVPAPTAYPQAPAPVQIPWQLTPASTASEAQGEQTHVYRMPDGALVRGTPIAVSEIDQPLVPYPGRSEAERACARVVRRQAASLGATSVEAGMAGPSHRLWSGNRKAQVFFRVTYPHDGLTEIRQGALLCTTGPRGRLVSAVPA